MWNFVKKHKVSFRIAKPRKSKLGDYRPPQRGNGHRISVNADLNPYAFLITVLHEFAHLVTWNDFGNKCAPHGREWKLAFKQLLKPYMEAPVFPDDVQEALGTYLVNPAASSCVDVNLSKALNKHDLVQKTMLEDLPEGSTFRLKNGLVFEKGQRLRKRFKCFCLTNNRWYYVAAIAEVQPIKAQAKLF
ncbi:MAG: SprT-like domain-containing protein [Bacteroidia bacterium]|nr:SprT-like domain-containing protein [Bacteroidia bacterium]